MMQVLVALVEDEKDEDEDKDDDDEDPCIITYFESLTVYKNAHWAINNCCVREWLNRCVGATL